MPGLFDSGGGPDFSLAGMLLGGRGYASNWFQQRDQMAWQRAAQAEQDAAEKAYGAGLLQRPEYQKFRDDPYSRPAALDLWAQTRGAPGDIDQDLAGYVGTGLSAQYNKLQAGIQAGHAATQANLQAQLQKENAAYGQSLDQKTIDYRNEQDLKLYEQKAAHDASLKQKTIDSLANIGGEVAQNEMWRLRGFELPQDKSVYVNEQGQPMVRPATWSTDYQKMMSQVTAGETMIDQMSEMNLKLERGDFSKNDWDSSVGMMQMTAKNLFESGALDQGSLDVMNKIIPQLARTSNMNPTDIYRAQETLRATMIQLQRRNLDVATSFAVPIGQLPKAQQDKKYFPTPRGEPPAEGSVTRATKTIEAQPQPKQPSAGKPYDSSTGIFQ